MSTHPAASPARDPALWGNLVALLLLVSLCLGLSALQGDDWWLASPQDSRWIGATTALIAYAFFCTAILWRSHPHTAGDDAAGADAQSSILIAYASQTGFARQLAARSAESLRSSGVPVKLRAIEQVDRLSLASTERALFIASTTGEGDPPDPALAFVRGVMAQPATLDHLRYAVLALGDREYDHFCGFGHRLDNWLRQHGAQPLFDIVEVDNADESALRHWQHRLGQIGGITDLPDWTPPRYEPWRLLGRTELNPGSVGGGAFHLAIAPPTGSFPHWKAGDIAEIGPRNSPQAVADVLEAAGLDADAVIERDGEPQQTLGEILARSHLPAGDEIRGRDAQTVAKALEPLPHREYSIASLPADGTLDILLRRLLRPDGTPGIGSGWLCDYAPPGGQIALRLRSNPNFHPPEPARPMILIGNGTGIAGLRAQLKARVASGARRNWLLFGERNADRDFFFGDDIRRWQAQGFLERLDLAFSRDQDQAVYVQHKLLAATDTLREWVVAGAAVYVCGSLAGMAPGVDTALRSTLGDDRLEQMLAQGLYRRDVY